jgi:hypothetical protein
MSAIPVLIANQARPEDAPAPTNYAEAIASYSNTGTHTLPLARDVRGVETFSVEAPRVADSILRLLDRAAQKESGTAARDFPAIMVYRMAESIADDLNAAGDPG